MQNSAYSKDYGDTQVQDKSKFVRKSCDQESLLDSEKIKPSHSVIDMNLSKQRQNGTKNQGKQFSFDMKLDIFDIKQKKATNRNRLSQVVINFR